MFSQTCVKPEDSDSPPSFLGQDRLHYAGTRPGQDRPYMASVPKCIMHHICIIKSIIKTIIKTSIKTTNDQHVSQTVRFNYEDLTSTIGTDDQDVTGPV